MSAARLANIASSGRPKKIASLEAISQSAAAGMLGIGRATVHRAAAILADSIFVPAVDAGTVSVSDAYAVRDKSDDDKRRAVSAVSEGEAPTLQAALHREAAVDPAGLAESGGTAARGSGTLDGSEPSMATERSGRGPGVPKKHPGSSRGEAGGATVLNDDSPDADDETGTELDLERTVDGIADALESLLSIAAKCRTARRPRHSRRRCRRAARAAALDALFGCGAATARWSRKVWASTARRDSRFSGGFVRRAWTPAVWTGCSGLGRVRRSGAGSRLEELGRRGIWTRRR